MRKNIVRSLIISIGLLFLVGCGKKEDLVNWESLEGMWCRRVTICPNENDTDTVLDLNLTVHISKASEDGFSALVCEGTTPLYQGTIVLGEAEKGEIPIIGIKKDLSGKETPWGVTLEVDAEGVYYAQPVPEGIKEYFSKMPE